MKISKRHQVFSNIISTPRALEYPGEFLGPNWKDVLNFWLFIETLSPGQIALVDYKIQIDSFYDRKSLMDCALQVTAEYAADAFNLMPPKFDLAILELIGTHKLIQNGGELKYLSQILSLVAF